MRLIEISHPKLKATARVPEASVPVHVKSGWVVVDAVGEVPWQGPAPEEARIEAPAKSATVDEWREYAKHHGMPAEDADKATKGYLIDAYGGD